MKQHIWNKENLTVVYFATKYGLNSIKENVTSVCHKLDLSEGSFELLGKMINFIMTGEGLNPTKKRRMLISLVEELQESTMKDVKSKVCAILDSDICLQRETSKHNNKIAARTKVLNEELEATFNKKMSELGKFRRLRKVS